MIIEPQLSDWKKKGYISSRFARLPNSLGGVVGNYYFLVLPECPGEIKASIRETNESMLKHSGVPWMLFEEDYPEGTLIFAPDYIT